MKNKKSRNGALHWQATGTFLTTLLTIMRGGGRTVRSSSGGISSRSGVLLRRSRSSSGLLF